MLEMCKDRCQTLDKWSDAFMPSQIRSPMRRPSFKESTTVWVKNKYCSSLLFYFWTNKFACTVHPHRLSWWRFFMSTHPSQSYNHLLACNHDISVPRELTIYQAEEAAEKTICSNQELVTSSLTKGHICIVVRFQNASWKALVEWLPAKMHGTLRSA